MAGVNGFGTELQRGDGESPEVFTAIANMTNIQGPGMERDTPESTAHDTPDGWRTFKGGLKDGGEVEIEVRYDPADHDTLIADFEDSDPRNYKLVFPTTPVTTWTFKALLKGFQPEAPHDGLLAATLTFKVSGKPAIA